MFNTWGLRSVNTGTFNLAYHTNYTYPQQARNVVVTLLRVNNLVLDVLEYIPAVATVSGCARMVVGVGICAVTLAVGERHAQEGVIIQHWYDEALATGMAQITRGAFVVFVPYGKIINLALGALGTVGNLFAEAGNASVCQGCQGNLNHGPYPDPNYPFYAYPLYLV